MSTKEDVLNCLKQVYDSEIPANIVDLGFVYDVDIQGEVVNVLMTVASPLSGMSNFVIRDAKGRLEDLPDVREANVTLTFDPLWSPDKITEDGRRALAGEDPPGAEKKPQVDDEE